MNERALALTLYRRPDYTARVLKAISECYGIENYRVFFSVDLDNQYPCCWDVLRMAKEWNRTPSEVFSRLPKRGIDENKLFVLGHVFARYEFAVVLEDDIVPARDFLRFMEWVDANFRNDPTVLSASAYHKTYPEIMAHQYRVFRSHGFNCWGWGTWHDRWQAVIGDEKAYREWAGDLVNGRFDWWWKKWAEDRGLWLLTTEVSRTQNIGEKNGDHTTPETFANDYNPLGAWNLDLPDPDPSLWRIGA